MAKYTEGPWEINNMAETFEELGYNSATMETIVTSNPLMQIEVSSPSGLHEDQREANAHLIAAAPEMLEALEECMRVWINHGNQKAAIAKLARAAIKKAKGETE